jgi:hypothetical protein
MTHRPFTAVIAFRSELARDPAALAQPANEGAALLVALVSGFALLGESLFPNAEKVTKNACPYIRVSLRSTSLIPSPLRGPAYKGHPWPFTPLAASMPLAPLRADSIRPPERGVRRRLGGRAMEKQKAVPNLSQLANGRGEFVGWKTAKHFPPQSTLQSISNFAFENRWVSFALPTLRSLKARTTASLLGPLHTTESPIWKGRAQVLWRGLSHVGRKTAKHFHRNRRCNRYRTLPSKTGG